MTEPIPTNRPPSPALTAHRHLHRVDPGRNMARFYDLHIGQDLFGHVILHRSWGRIGTTGRCVQQAFGSDKEAVERLAAILACKIKRGYRDPRDREIGSERTVTLDSEQMTNYN